MFFNRTYFDLLFLFFDILLDDLEPLALGGPPGLCIVAACCALTRAEFKRGFLVEVPKKNHKTLFFYRKEG